MRARIRERGGQRAYIWAAVWLLCLCVGSVSWGQAIDRTQRGGDFNPASTAWNGLSAFVAEAVRLGLRVEAPVRWNWRQARVNVPIVIIAPRDEELSIKPLKDFVASGGRVLLADDFGTGDRLWEAFGLEGYRLAVPRGDWKKRRYVDLHRTFPHPHQEADFLLRQSGYLFLNVPQWLLIRRHSTAAPLLMSVPYRSNRPDRGMGGKVLWRVSHGRGKLVVFSDPSAFINQMIAYGDNHRFVRNVLQYLALPARSKRLVLLWGGAEWRGELTSHPPRGAVLSLSWWEAMTSLNSTLAPLPAFYKAYPPLWNPQRTAQTRQMPAESWSKAQVRLHRKYLGNRTLLVMLLLVCLVGILIRFAPLWGKPVEDRTMEDAMLAIPHRFEEQLESYREGALNYMGPLVLFKEELVSFLLEKLSVPLPTEQESSNRGVYLLDQLELLRQQNRLPVGIVRVLPQLQRLLLQIPGRHQWGTQEQRTVTPKTLKVYYNTAMLCLRSLGVEEEFRKSRWQSRPAKQHRNAVDASTSRTSTTDRSSR